MAANKKMVRTAGFVGRFVVGDIEVTAEGVELSATDLKRVQDAAETSNVTLLVDDDGDIGTVGTTATGSTSTTPEGS